MTMNPFNISTGHIYHLCWTDAASSSSWRDVEGLEHSPVSIETIGWVVKTTPDYVVVAASVSEDRTGDQCSDMIAIPLAVIVSATEVHPKGVRVV